LRIFYEKIPNNLCRPALELSKWFCSTGGVNAQYPTMKLSDIKALPINELSEDTSVLLLWATFPQLQETLEVMKAWGFTYKTLGFSWLKTNKDGTPFFGIGYYAKRNQETKRRNSENLRYNIPYFKIDK